MDSIAAIAGIRRRLFISTSKCSSFGGPVSLMYSSIPAAADFVHCKMIPFPLIDGTAIWCPDSHEHEGIELKSRALLKQLMHHIEQTVTARKLTRKGKVVLPQTSAILLTPHVNSPTSSSTPHFGTPSEQSCTSMSDDGEPPMLTPLESCATSTLCDRCAAQASSSAPVTEGCDSQMMCTCDEARASPCCSFIDRNECPADEYECDVQLYNDYDTMLAVSSSMMCFGDYQAVYQHNPYAVQVLPSKMYATEATKPRAAVKKQNKARQVGSEKKVGRSHLHHRNAIFQAPTGSAFGPVADCVARAPDAVAAPAAPLKPKSMCCYFKQKGFCKMGDKCWHGHEGDLYTPCHYGAECKAGHATLVQMVAAQSAAASFWMAEPTTSCC